MGRRKTVEEKLQEKATAGKPAFFVPAPGLQVVRGPATIGIRVREKASKNNEDGNPTQVCVVTGDGKTKNYALDTEQDELDFVFGRLPVHMRKATDNEDVSAIPTHMLEIKKLKKGDTVPKVHASRIRTVTEDGKKVTGLITHVPDQFEGLRTGDTVALILGGNGDYLAYALAKRAKELGNRTVIVRIPGQVLHNERGDADKDQDAELLARLAVAKRHLFYAVDEQNLLVTRLRVLLGQLLDVMDERKALGNRLRTKKVGRVFIDAGMLFEDPVAKQVEDAAVNNPAFLHLLDEEKRLERDLDSALAELPFYRDVLSKIKGLGSAKIPARILAGIGDARRFPTQAKLEAYAGLHVLGTDGKKIPQGSKPPKEGGMFARKRRGQDSGYQPWLRQGLHLFGDQLNRQQDATFYGAMLLRYKGIFKAKHPEPVRIPILDDKGQPKLNKRGKPETRLKWTDSDVHSAAKWRTLNKFLRWFWHAWIRYGKGLPVAIHQLETQLAADEPATRTSQEGLSQQL